VRHRNDGHDLSAADATDSAVHVDKGAAATMMPPPPFSVAGAPVGLMFPAPADHDDGTAEGLQPHAFAIVRIGRSDLEQLREWIHN
jgi:hypothetical protein